MSAQIGVARYGLKGRRVACRVQIFAHDGRSIRALVLLANSLLAGSKHPAEAAYRDSPGCSAKKERSLLILKKGLHVLCSCLHKELDGDGRSTSDLKKVIELRGFCADVCTEFTGQS
jgi:hypothetical protein